MKELRPDIKIYLYGSNSKKIVDFEAEKLGIIPIEECNRLYNKCKIGFCISASNPSRIPFEMMAAGLPVVEIYKENNLYDFPDGGIKLAEPNPEAIATTMLELIDDDKELKRMSEIGNAYMQDKPLEKGFEQFVEAVNNLLKEEKIKKLDIKPSYKKEPVKASKEIQEAAKKIFGEINIVAPDGPTKRKLRRIKRRTKDILKAICYKMIHLIDRI